MRIIFTTEDVKKTESSLPQIYLLDAHVLAFASVPQKLRKKLFKKSQLTSDLYGFKIVDAIKNGQTTNCGSTTVVCDEIRELTREKHFSKEELNEWWRNVIEDDGCLFYEVVVDKSEYDAYYSYLSPFNLGRGELSLLIAAISIGSEIIVSEDNDIYRAYPTARKLHRDRHYRAGYKPLSIIDTKYFCQKLSLE